MSFGWSAARGNAALDTWGDAANSGNVVFYTGAPPATVDDAATGSEVARCPLNTDAFTVSAENGTNSRITMNTSPAVEDTNATGNASAIGYFRIENSVATDIAQGDVTATSGGGDIELSSTTIANGETLTLTSLTIDLPQLGA